MVVGGTILEADLSILGHRFRIGELSTEAVAARRRQIAQVTGQEIVGRIPFARLGIDRRTIGQTSQLVRPRVRIARPVRIVHVAVEGDRPAVLAQLGPVDGRRAEVVAARKAVAVVVRTAVTALAVLPALRRAPRIVRLVAETRADHQILVIRDLPLEAAVETVVVVPRIGITERRKGIDRHRGLVPLVYRRTVRRVGAVEEVAALERHLVALAPRVRIVQTDGIDLGHAALGAHHVLTHTATAAAAAARHTEDVLEREILLIDVVKEADHRHAAVAREDIDVSTGDVFVVRIGFGIISIARIEFSELALTHARFGYNIEGLVPLTVVHAGELGRIREFVVNLDTVYSLGRQRLDGRRHILAEKLLAIDENLLDLLALGLDRTVGDGNTRHLLEQTLDIGIGRHLEGPGVVAHRIALLRSTHRFHLLDHGFDLHARLEAQHTEIYLRSRHTESRIECIVTQEGDRESVFTVAERREGDEALVGRRGILFLVGCRRGSQRQHRTDHLVAGVGIHERCRDGSLLREGGNGKQHHEGCQQCLFHHSVNVLLVCLRPRS